MVSLGRVEAEKQLPPKKSIENSSNSFTARIVNQTISSIVLEWDPVADADVYKIELHHKPDTWTRVYWGSTPSAKVDRLDENFCYKFRISALKYQSKIPGYATLATSDTIMAVTLPAQPTTIHLYRAIKKGQQFLVKRILNTEPSLVDISSPNGYYPLANAIILGEMDIIDILLSTGASVHIGNRTNSVTPLHLAFYYGHVAVAKVLVNKNAKLNAQDCIDLTPAHYAIIAEQQDLLKFAIESKCDMEAKDVCGWTLLLRAGGETRANEVIFELLPIHCQIGSSSTITKANEKQWLSTQLAKRCAGQEAYVLPLLVRGSHERFYRKL